MNEDSFIERKIFEKGIELFTLPRGKKGMARKSLCNQMSASLLAHSRTFSI